MKYNSFQITEKLLKRFWKKVKKTKTCWLWIGSINIEKYGLFWINDKMVKSHRVSWELHNGPILKGTGYHGTCICHKCDNPACVNPKHLFIGTHTDNMKDRNLKNRHFKVIGEANGKARLTEKKVLKIRSLYSIGNISQRKLAKQFNVGQITINRIVNRQNWRHI